MPVWYNCVMELRHLRYFVAVADLLSFSRAAERLGIAQPAVSRQIADLEDTVGVRLLKRTKRVVTLTAAGHTFLGDARRVLDQAEHATDRARRASRGEVGELKIAFLGAPTMRFLPAVVKAYRRQFPTVTVSLFEMTPERQLEAFADGRLHLGFTRPLLAHRAHGFRSELVFTEALRAVLPETHRLARKKRVRLADLAADPFVLLERNEATGLFDETIASCRAAGFSPSIVSAPNLMATVLTLVAAEQGVSLVPESVRNLAHSDVVFRDLHPKARPIPLVMIWNPDFDSPPLAAFLQVIRERLGEIRRSFVR
jgi:DNA-binding transcriptional LysR family regulator